jgi:hypothetical protein
MSRAISKVVRRVRRCVIARSDSPIAYFRQFELEIKPKQEAPPVRLNKERKQKVTQGDIPAEIRDNFYLQHVVPRLRLYLGHEACNEEYGDARDPWLTPSNGDIVDFWNHVAQKAGSEFPLIDETDTNITSNVSDPSTTSLYFLF